MSDLVKRLRLDAIFDRLSDPESKSLSSGAADRIEQLERVLAQAREALAIEQQQQDAGTDERDFNPHIDEAIEAIDEALK